MWFDNLTKAPAGTTTILKFSFVICIGVRTMRKSDRLNIDLKKLESDFKDDVWNTGLLSQEVNDLEREVTQLKQSFKGTQNLI